MRFDDGLGSAYGSNELMFLYIWIVKGTFYFFYRLFLISVNVPTTVTAEFLHKGFGESFRKLKVKLIIKSLHF